MFHVEQSKLRPMKLQQTLILILIGSSAIDAQEHIIGIKAGPVRNFNGNVPDKHEVYQTIEKGRYYRYNNKKQLSLEIGLAYHNYTEQTGPTAIYDAGFSIYDSKYIVDIIDVRFLCSTTYRLSSSGTSQF